VIRVTQQSEPIFFDSRIRQRGNQFRLNNATKPLPDYWRECLSDLWYAYSGICAYSCMRMMLGSSEKTVDHYHPRSNFPELAYEWSNYRLASRAMNSNKGTKSVIIDPFDVEDDWFVMSFPDAQINSNEALPSEIKARVETTIRELKLNLEPAWTHRQEWLGEYCSDGISFEHLKKYAPFMARELQRQGLEAQIKEMFIWPHGRN
jgi:hypothetical protein